MEKNFETLRPAGRLERFSCARHDLRFYLGPAVTASYTLPGTSNTPLKNCLYRALKTVIAEHPALSAIPVDEHTQAPYFVRLPEVHLDQCVVFQQRRAGPVSESASRDAELNDLLSKQHGTPFEAPNPFWRLCILTSKDRAHEFTTTFLYHHALGDGTSGLAFHRALQRAMSQVVLISGEEPVEAIVPSATSPLLPSLESLHPLPTTWWHLLKVLFRAKVWPYRDPGLWTGGKCISPLGVTRVEVLAFSSSTTTAFKNICRQNNTTITAALQTLLAGLLFQQLPENFTSLICSGPLSARRFLPPDAGVTDDNIGVWVLDMSETYLRSNFPPSTALPWAEAHRSRRMIEQSLAQNGVNTAVGLLKYVGDYQEELILPKVGNDRSNSFEVSNLGLFKADAAENGVRIGRMVFTQSAGVISEAINTSVVTGVDGCMVLGFSWQEGTVEARLLEKVITGVEVEIERLAQHV